MITRFALCGLALQSVCNQIGVHAPTYIPEKTTTRFDCPLCALWVALSGAVKSTAAQCLKGGGAISAAKTTLANTESFFGAERAALRGF